MADRLAAVYNRGMSVCVCCTCDCFLFLRDGSFIEPECSSVWPVLQLIMIFICGSFPSWQLLLVREDRVFALAEFLPRSTRIMSCLDDLLQC